MAKATSDNPFADYMWMGEMDQFDQQVEHEIKEEEFIKFCIEQLLDEEEEQTVYYENNGHLNEVTVDKKPSYNPCNDQNYKACYYNYNHQSNQQVPGLGEVESLTQDMRSMYIQTTNQKSPAQNGFISSTNSTVAKSKSTPQLNSKYTADDILSKTKLNVNAQPFHFQPKRHEVHATAPEFYPRQGFTTHPTNVCYEQPSHCKYLP